MPRILQLPGGCRLSGRPGFKKTPARFASPIGEQTSLGWSSQPPAQHRAAMCMHPVDRPRRAAVARVGFYDQQRPAASFPASEPILAASSNTRARRGQKGAGCAPARTALSVNRRKKGFAPGVKHRLHTRSFPLCSARPAGRRRLPDRRETHAAVKLTGLDTDSSLMVRILSAINY